MYFRKVLSQTLALSIMVKCGFTVWMCVCVCMRVSTSKVTPMNSFHQALKDKQIDDGHILNNFREAGRLNHNIIASR